VRVENYELLVGCAFPESSIDHPLCLRNGRILVIEKSNHITSCAYEFHVEKSAR
jgi:UDP-galactopyranose mutase